MTGYLRHEIEKVLRAMGYRPFPGHPDGWCKPVGWSLFVIRIHPDKLRWENWFMGAQGGLLVWDSAEWTIADGAEQHGTVLYWVKEMEAYNGKMMPFTGERTEFEFLTREESAQMWMESTKPPDLSTLWGHTTHTGERTPDGQPQDPRQAGLERTNAQEAT